MASTITEISLEGLTQHELAFIQRHADEWGVSFDEACKRLLLQHSRELRGRAPSRPSLFARLFSRGSVH